MRTRDHGPDHDANEDCEYDDEADCDFDGEVHT